jgi:alpha-amylase/alpha-mannosidase (GH57 family)
MPPLPPKKIAQGYVVIHGHFYQPPRENPWIEQIEVETSAHPYHDWNTRINVECYSPNSCARVFDNQSRILDIINNYELISFNFGPTLLSWLEAKAPLAYRRLLDADHRSLGRLGHGNALAQAYNHAILPLANPRDRETQIIWGLEDFSHRFQRPAEAMWLPETAVNLPTLAALAQHGMKFVILSPFQALRVRSLAGGPWERVQADTLDTTQAYRCFLPDGEGKPAKRQYIEVFFYNGAVAADISFGDLLQDSNRLAAHLAEGFSPATPRPQILHVATDGENYGHHKKFGELALAHALTQALPQKGFQLYNYAAFLEMAPPQMEVELYLGPTGEGSSWSCAHGVERWRSDCGCATGGQPTWNQRWRSPLREAFDFLNERLADIFESQGQKYLRDPWEARNAYIQVILDRNPETLARFFAREGTPDLNRGDWVPALKLLEMQRHALLMYTSCGWFFADLAGLETLQVLKYAARALQLGQDFTPEALETPFLEHLQLAVSNLPAAGSGRDIYLQRIKPHVVDFPKVVNQWAITWLKERERQCPTNIYHFQVETLELAERAQGSLILGAGRLLLHSGATLRSQQLNFFTVFMGSYLYRTQIMQSSAPQDFHTLQQELFQVLETTPEDLIASMARHLGERYYSFHDMFLDEKQEIFQDLLRHNLDEALAVIAHNFEEAQPLLKAMAADGLPLPRLFQTAGEITLNNLLVELLQKLETDHISTAIAEELLEIVREASVLGLKLESLRGGQILGRILDRHIQDLAADFTTINASRLKQFVVLMSHVPITLELTEAQNLFFSLMEERFAKLAARAAADTRARTLSKLLIDLAEALYFSPVRYLKLLA